MDQVAFSFYSVIFNILPQSWVSCPQQKWQKWIQPNQAFHPVKGMNHQGKRKLSLRYLSMSPRANLPSHPIS